jgi:hypothetical protein
MRADLERARGAAAGGATETCRVIEHTCEVVGNRFEVTAKGETRSVDDVVEYLVDAATRCKDEGLNKLLFDHRQLSISVGTAGSYELACRWAERMPHRGAIKIALVTRLETLSRVKLYETLGVGTGVVIKVFDRLKMARTWLAF